MSRVIADLTMSLDGFVAGPDPSLEHPLGIGGEHLHEWAFAAMAWRRQHGYEGGDGGEDSLIFEELQATVGASVMGRKMYSSGEGPWEQDPMARGWWGDEPPFHYPVFVLTRHAREPLEMEGGTTFTFVTDGIESALAQAREAAGGRDVQINGGGSVVRQYLAAGLLDELQVHIAPVLLGSGTPLLGGATAKLERARVMESPTGVVHVRYRVLK
jgi:dihydrofolate reductase